MINLPTYIAQPVEDGMVALAICTDPAVEVQFQAFSKVSPLCFSINNEEKRIVTGPLIRCNYKILRQHPDGSLYYVVFTPEVAQKMLSKFLFNGYQNNVNLDHTSLFPEGIEPLEFYIKDSSRGISPSGFDDVSDGSVFCTYHISNDLVWNSVKDGTFKGFSLEAYLTTIPSEDFSSLSISDLLISILT